MRTWPSLRCKWTGDDGSVCGTAAVDWPALPACPLGALRCWEHLSSAELEHCHAVRDASGTRAWTLAVRSIADMERIRAFRQTWTNAYNPWGGGDDAELRTLWETGGGVTNIAEHLGRHPETVRARLVLLGAADVPASVTAYAIASHRARAHAAEVAASQMTAFDQLAAAGVPDSLLAPTWLALALLVECVECCADAGQACTGPAAVDTGGGTVVCPSRPGQIPVITADRCTKGDKGYRVDRSDGWTEYCWNHLQADERAACRAERTEIYDEADNEWHMFLDVDIERAESFLCVQCRAEPDIPCRGEWAERNTMPHPARIKAARSHRRARTYLESQEPVLPFL